MATICAKYDTRTYYARIMIDVLRIMKPGVASISMVPLADGRIVAGSSGEYRLRVFDRVGNLERVFTRAFWPTNLDHPAQCMAMVRSGDAPDLDNWFTADVYDSDWTLPYSFEGSGAEEAGPLVSLLAVDANDRLYIRMPGGVTRGRYRMEVARP